MSNSIESTKEQIKQDMVNALEEAIYGLGYQDLFDKESSRRIKDLVYQAQCLVEQL